MEGFLPFFEELGVAEYLLDPEIEDLMMQPGGVFVMREGRQDQVNVPPISERKLRLILESLAAELNDSIGPGKQNLNARLPDGSRLAAILPPASPWGVVVSIRKFGRFRTLEDLRDGVLRRDGTRSESMMTEEVFSLLLELATDRRNTLVSGEMGSGKSTLIQAMLDKLPISARIVTMEKPIELRLRHPNVVRLEAVTGLGEQQEVTLGDLLTWSLRLNASYLVFGEVRAEEAGDMMRAMRTGHPGISTIHARTSKTALEQAAFLASVRYGGNVTLARQEAALSIQNVVQVGKDRSGQRRVLEVLEVGGYHVTKEQFRVKYLYRAEGEKR